MHNDDPIVEAYSTENPVLLQLITIKLGDNGIIAKIFDESISSVYHLQALSSRIMVHQSNLAKAKRIIHQIEESIRKQETDFDFKEADQADIEYEKEVFQQDDIINKAGPRNLILILIIAVLILILFLLAFD